MINFKTLDRGLILIVSILLALGLITGIIPAVNALRLNIVTAFSKE